MDVNGPPLSDYGKLYTTWDPYAVSQPATAVEVQAAVRQARAEGRAVRVRGSAHTFSGATVPRAGELLLRTNRLEGFSFEAPGTITVGAGALVWDVRDFVAAHGLAMPVYNGGWAGPTVGGYLCAGGMGLRVPPDDRERWLAMPVDARPPLSSISEVHGGFWEHVRAITLVDGTGAVQHIDDSDEAFPWLFGCFGQFGVIVDVTLALLPADPAIPYPLGLSGRIPRVQADDPAVNDGPPSAAGERILCWFSYLVRPDQEEEAWRALGEWVHDQAPALQPQGGWVGPIVNGEPIGYRYEVRFRRFNPPLLYDRQASFVLMGLMATFTAIGTKAGDERLLDAERQFLAIARREGFRLYPQAENIGRRLDYEAYYGRDLFDAFARLKARFDPDRVINPGIVFPSETPPPARSSLSRLAAATFARLFGGVR